MVCDRCILVVRQQLNNLGLLPNLVILGSAQIEPSPSAVDLVEISSALHLLGFELIDNEKDRLIERIKNLIIEKVHHSDLAAEPVSFSKFLADRLGKDYAYLSRLFSESQETTIEKFIIQQKVEKVKELLEYGELNLNEIAYTMGYSSSAHLSAQFKSVTGMTTSQFRDDGRLERRPIDKLI